MGSSPGEKNTIKKLPLGKSSLEKLPMKLPLGKNLGAALGKVPSTERKHPTDWIKKKTRVPVLYGVYYLDRKLYIYIYYKSYDHYI